MSHLARSGERARSSDRPTAWLLLPHLHEEWAFHPPQRRHAAPDLYAFRAGETVRVHCEWDTADTITFGREMCVLTAMTEDARGAGSRVCDRGTRSIV